MRTGTTAAALSLDPYLIEQVDRVLTPALAIYPRFISNNIEVTIGLLDGRPDRWRPHVKTSKLALTMRMLSDRGIINVKASTTLELATALDCGANDVLLAYPLIGAGVNRVRSLAENHRRARVSALVENREQVRAWADSPVGLFVDINPGMNRTGIEQDRVADIVELARGILESGIEFRGLHYYDGHLGKFGPREREIAGHAGYDQLIRIVDALAGSGISVEEVITAGTPAFPCTLSYDRFKEGPFVHRASPGTVIYGDCTSLGQLPSEWGYRPGALVVSTVVSKPSGGLMTCDAGHKTVSADAGSPTCEVLGYPELTPLKPSEEHLPIEARGVAAPSVGDFIYLLPRHICPTVNNFDHALIIVENRITGVERVTARGRETPLESH